MLVYGVGINDADYVIHKYKQLPYINGKQRQLLVWICPFYKVWRNMIRRCYSMKHTAAKPTYKDISVCDEWHRFSTFKTWMETQDWEGKQLDKDILDYSAKLYCPDTCVFVTSAINNFVLECNSRRGKYKVGVSWSKPASKFRARCSNPFTKQLEHLGVFETEEEAHQAWLAKKLEHARALAELQTDERVAKALINRYENYQEGE